VTVEMDYHKRAFEIYTPICAYCGFGIRDVLEVAHIDGDRNNNDADNLVILCPTCHKMLDIDIIPAEAIRAARERTKGVEVCTNRVEVDWAKRMKDAGRKAARTRKRRAAGKKAAETRKRNVEREQRDP